MEEFKGALDGRRFSFKKKYGQNFLTDANLLDAIARDAGAGEAGTVLEIGAGAGALTAALARKAQRVVSYEIDRDLRPILEEALSPYPNVELRFADFMKADLPRLEEELGDYILAANLPYYVTTPVIMRFVEESTRCRSLTIMIQQEVAARLCAAAGTAEYGAITAAVARRGSCTITRKVPAAMFYPRPKVDSAVVRIDLSEGFPVKSVRAYREIVRCAFLNRRKTLENNMMGAFSRPREEVRALLGEEGILEGVRGETLSPRRFASLADRLYEKGWTD